MLIFDVKKVSIQDMWSGKLLLEGPTTNGLYELPLKECVPIGNSIFSIEPTSIDTWHRRLAYQNHASVCSLARNDLICV